MVRSTFVRKASIHTICEAVLPSTWCTTGSKVNAPDKKCKPIFNPRLHCSKSCISSSASVRPKASSKFRKMISGTLKPRVRAISPPINSAIRALVPCPAPLNFTTYLNSSSASAKAGNDPPSRRGRIYLVTFAVRKSISLLS